MAQRRAERFHNENIFAFPRNSPAPEGAATALDLVYQAAEVFREMEERARETEVRAQSLCKAAAEKVRAAVMRAEAAERGHRELYVSADHKLQDASRALEQAQSRITAQEDRLAALEFKTQAAEAEAREAKNALALVEEAIRKRLLTTNFTERDGLIDRLMME
jgi:vacuolar-type H+-ATPase subunit I/STV1